MKQIVSTVAACLLLGAGATLMTAQETPSQGTESQNPQPSVGTATTVTRVGIVQAIDQENRTVTLQGQRGRTFTVKVGPEVKRFNELKKGDRVTFRRQESLALSLRRANETPASTGEQQTIMRAPSGQQPGGAVINTTQMTATVEDINQDNSEVTLRGSGGRTKTLKVEDPQVLSRIQKGDQVVATYTEAYTIQVTSPG
jgi:Cu/Ag efflux protein CusF